MACCLMAPSHHLNQCWLIINVVLWHAPDSNFTISAHKFNLNHELENRPIKIIATSPRGHWVKPIYNQVLLYSGSIYHDITYSTTITAAEHQSDFVLTEDTPYLTFTNELWGICCILEKIDHVIMTPHCIIFSPNVFIYMCGGKCGWLPIYWKQEHRHVIKQGEVVVIWHNKIVNIGSGSSWTNANIMSNICHCWYFYSVIIQCFTRKDVVYHFGSSV